MTTTIKQLREVAGARTKGAKDFKKKHVTVKHLDRNGNKDDVFQATNVSTVKRHPEHGYDVGRDDDVYEAVDKDAQRALQQKRMRDLGYSHPNKKGVFTRKGNPKIDLDKEGKKDGNLYDPKLLVKDGDKPFNYDEWVKSGKPRRMPKNIPDLSGGKGLKKEETEIDEAAMSARAQAQVQAWNDNKKQENVKRSIEYIKARLKIAKDPSRKAAYEKDLRSFMSMVKEELVDDALLEQYVVQISEETHRPEHLKPGTSIRTKKMSMMGKVTKVEKHPAYGHAVYFQVGDGRTMRTPISNVQMVKEETEQLDEWIPEKVVVPHPDPKQDSKAVIHIHDVKNGADFHSKWDKESDAHQAHFGHDSPILPRGEKGGRKTIKMSYADWAKQVGQHASLKEEMELDEQVYVVSRNDTGNIFHMTKYPRSALAMHKKVTAKGIECSIHKGPRHARSKVDPAELAKGLKEDVITELSTSLLARYKKAAGADASAANKRFYQSADSKDRLHADKRFSGIVKATKKQFANDVKEDVEQIDELSKKTLGSYVKKAADSAVDSALQAGNDFARAADKSANDKDSFDHAVRKVQKAYRRQDGIAKAATRLTKEETEQLDEYVNKIHKDHFAKALDNSTLPQASIDKVKEHVKKHFSDVEHLIRPDMKNIARGTGVDEGELCHHARLKEEVELTEEVMDPGTVKVLKKSGHALIQSAKNLPAKHMDKWAIHHAGHLLSQGKVKQAREHIATQDTACRDEIFDHIHPKHYHHFGVEPINAKKATISYHDTMRLSREGAEKAKADAAKKKKKLKEETDLDEGRGERWTHVIHTRSLHGAEPSVSVKVVAKTDLEAAQIGKEKAKRMGVRLHKVEKYIPAMAEEQEMNEALDPKIGAKEYAKAHKDAKSRLDEVHRLVNLHSAKALETGSLHFGHVGDLERVHSDLKELHRSLVMSHEHSEKDHKLQKRLAKIHEDLQEAAGRPFAEKEYLRVKKDVHKRIAEIAQALDDHAAHAKEAGHNYEHIGTVNRAHSALKHIHHYMAGLGEYASGSGHVVNTYTQAHHPQPVHEECSKTAMYKKYMMAKRSK